MKILAMDTSGQTASAALVDGNKLVGEYTQNDKLTHSQTILPMIAEICRQTNTEPAELDYIACAVGPGSFTGLRIGAATAKGLCLGWDKPLIPVPTLDALAYNVFMTDAVVCPIMDARRNQVYACFYQWHGEILVPLTKYMAESIEIVMEMAQRWKRRWRGGASGTVDAVSRFSFCTGTLCIAACCIGSSAGAGDGTGGEGNSRQQAGADLSAQIPGRTGAGSEAVPTEGGSRQCLRSFP